MSRSPSSSRARVRHQLRMFAEVVRWPTVRSAVASRRRSSAWSGSTRTSQVASSSAQRTSSSASAASAWRRTSSAPPKPSINRWARSTGGSREQLGGVAVEPAPQAGVDLADVVLDQSVQLRLEVRVAVEVGELDELGQLAVGEALVDAAHRLVPHELDGIAAAGQFGADVIGAADRRAVRSDEVRRPKADHVVEAGEQDPRVAVLLAADGEHVEQRRPRQVVDAHRQFGKPDRDRVGRRRTRPASARRSSPASEIVTASSKVSVGGRNPSVNGAFSGIRNAGPRPALTSASGPSAGRRSPN